MRLTDERGLTLIEIIVVVVIIGIMSAFAVPNYLKWRPNIELRGIARDLYSSMQNAKMAAVKSNANVIMELNDATRTVTVFVDDGGSGAGTANDEILNGDEEVIITHVLDSDVTMVSSFSFGSTKPGFNPQGLPFSGRIGNITIQNGNNRWYKVTLSIAGAIKIEMSGDGITWN